MLIRFDQIVLLVEVVKKKTNNRHCTVAFHSRAQYFTNRENKMGAIKSLKQPIRPSENCFSPQLPEQELYVEMPADSILCI